MCAFPLKKKKIEGPLPVLGIILTGVSPPIGGLMRLIACTKRELLRLSGKLTNVVVPIRMIDTSTHLDHHIKLLARFFSRVGTVNWMARSKSTIHYGLRMHRGNLALVLGRQHVHQKNSFNYRCGMCGPLCKCRYNVFFSTYRVTQHDLDSSCNKYCNLIDQN